MVKVVLTYAPDGTIPNKAQLLALAKIAGAYKADEARAMPGAFGLSSSYLGFTLVDRHKSHLLTGGIDQEGSIST